MNSGCEAAGLGADTPKNAVGWERGHMHCYYSFLNCVASGKTPSPSLEEGARLQKLMDLMARSAQVRAWVTID